MQNTTENKIPDWLKNLQENSWELELLVSGGAIFTLLQLSDLYIEWINTLLITSFIPGIRIIEFAGMVGIKILTIGFILHLILRAFWLGLVCINYVFPGGINGSRLKQQKPFAGKHVAGDLKDQIMRIDSHCGMLMFTSIISAVAITGISFLFAILIGTVILLEISTTGSVLEFTGTALILFFILYILDLLLMGVFRKIPLLSYVFFPVFKLYDYLSFRSYYQRPLNLFSSNVRRLRFFSGALLFSLVTIISSYMALYRTMHWPNLFDGRAYKWQLADGDYMAYSFYRDQNSEHNRSRASIQSKIVQSNFLDVFVLYERRFDDLISQTPTPDSLRTFADITGIQIDDSCYQQVTWNPYWNEEITNIGINTVIDISHLTNGEHLLRIYTDNTRINSSPNQESFEVRIPFWKDVN
ncbi:MAG: hypothetical protein HYZ14_06475 [Bacteroidetes bacterium]|nr:hypothetical protein [Bacteroidota bacterium]